MAHWKGSEMFEDGDSASRRLLQEQAKRREAAKRRRESEALAAKRVEAAAADARKLADARRAAEEARLADEARAKRREERMTGGVLWKSGPLRAVAVAADGDRVELPSSALSELDDAIEMLRGKPLTFELRILGQANVPWTEEDEDGYSFAADATHAGVSAFSANEGEIGMPPKTMLSLAKRAPDLAAKLESGEAKVQARFVRLPAVHECTARLRPLSLGFFEEGTQSMELDLRSVLERELSQHTALTQGDIFAVDYAIGKTARLKVESLEPHRALCVLATDLTVDILPSESVEAERAREAARLERRQATSAVRRARADVIIPPSHGPVRALLRYRDGARVEWRFEPSDPASALVRVVDRHLDDNRLDLDFNDWILVATYPKRVLTRAALLVDSQRIADVVQNGQAFLVEPATGDDSVDEHRLFEESEVWNHAQSFADAEEQRRKRHDETQEAPGRQNDTPRQDDTPLRDITGADRAALFAVLVELGLDNKVAASAAQRYGPQLVELETMGLLRPNPQLALNYLDRYQGRMLRVVNALSDALSDTDHSSTPESTQSVTPTPHSAQHLLLPAIFQRLVADGTQPNDAAAQAIVLAADPRSADLLANYNGAIDRTVTAILASSGAA